MQKKMFNDKYGLTKAVLEGKKTQSRGIIPESQLKDIEKFQEEFFNETLDFLEGKELLEQYFLVEGRKKPRYAVGEVLAVAQSYETIYTEMSNCPDEEFNYPTIHLKNIKSLVKTARSRKVADILKIQDQQEIIRDYAPKSETVVSKKIPNVHLKKLKTSILLSLNQAFKDSPGWQNKMFVKAYMMLHLIRITGFRLERLQDISDEDCLKEGIHRWEDEKDYLTDKAIRKSIDELKAAGYDTYAIPRCWDCYTSPREAYAALINKISGKGTWEKNPWVFVYDFELVK